MAADDEDVLSVEAEARTRTRQLGQLTSVLRRSVRMVHEAAGRLLWLAAGVQLVLAGLAAVQVLAVQWALQALVDLDRDAASARAVILPFVCVVIPILAMHLLTSVNDQVQRVLGERVEQHTWDRVLTVSTKVDLATYESPSFYDQLRRTEASTLMRPFQVTMGLVNFGGALVAVVLLTATLARIQPWLPLVLLVGAVPLMLLARRLADLEFGFAVRVTALQRERRYLREVLMGRSEAKEIRSLEAVEPLMERHHALCAQYLDELARQARRASLVGLAGAGATSIVSIAGLAIAVVLVADGRATLAEAGAIVVGIRLLAERLRLLSSSVGTLFESALFLDDLEAFETRAPQPGSTGTATAPRDARPAPPPLTGLTLEGVSFTYPGSRAPAVEGIHLTLERGEVVALVGENGSGKTTISKLIAQLYEPTRGRIRWNGLDAAALDADARRHQVSVTFQDFVRFSLTAAQNISLGGGALAPPQERVVDAARRAGADGFLGRLPLGYQTRLGKEFSGGTDLSGGQWQRVALARAFYRDAPLVVLDEPTASLDPRAEHELFRDVRSLFADRAVLLVTHRLASVRSADRIYVLHDGRIVEDGSHEQLMAGGGRYAELFTMQAAGFLAAD